MLEAPAPTPSVPRQARSKATRARLLEAAVAVLVESGWNATTTPEVGRRAGVSQGAVFKHFPSKALLVAAAVEHLFARLIREFRAAFAGIGDDPVGEAVAILWRIHHDPRLQAAYELYLAARTDRELRRALAPVLTRHRDALHAEAARLFPEAARGAGFAEVVDLVLSALQGAALTAIPLPDDADAPAQRERLEALARRELAELAERARAGS